MNFEIANQIDEKLLNEVLTDEKYEWIKSYDVHIKMFYKYGKYDKDGNLKSPALQKMGKPILLAIRIVSSFNRLTDDVDVKILINKDIWETHFPDERKASLDGILSYLEMKTDKLGEPIPISEDNDKVQLKLKHPDFFCEGFISMAEKYGNNYLPIQEAKSITNLVKSSSSVKEKKKDVKKIEKKKEDEEVSEDWDSATDAEDAYREMYEDDKSDEVNLDDIKI